MKNNTRFLEAERYIVRTDKVNEIQLRLIHDDVVMYKNMNLEQMKSMVQFLTKQIESIENSTKES